MRRQLLQCLRQAQSHIRLQTHVSASVSFRRMVTTRSKTSTRITVHMDPGLARSISLETLQQPPAKKIKLDTVASIPAESQVSSSSTVKRKRKQREDLDLESDAVSFLERTTSAWKVGAHVSASGGVENAVVNAAKIGANAFALFVKSQRKWSSPPLTSESIMAFKTRMKEYGYSSSVVLPHGSYLINLGNPDPEKRAKSYECFLDDLRRCEDLGLELYNFHPGSTVGETTTANSISLIAQCINRAHKETQRVTVVLENMEGPFAGAGNIIGSEFAHLAGIIAEVEKKSRVGICLDTCHSFAAGFDIRTKQGWDATMAKFDLEIGLSYLRGMHLNDSKAELGSKKDRHENIGLGHLGVNAFSHILTDPRVQNIPLILETPSFESPTEVWGKEIKLLEELSNIQATAGIDALADELKEAVVRVGSSEKKPKKRRLQMDS